MSLSKFITLTSVALIALVLLWVPNTANADTIFVGGKEYPIDPNVAAIYQYIDMMDPNFEWHELPNVVPHNDTKKGFVSYRVEFTSQRWLTESEVNYSIWKHNLTIVVPYELELEGVSALYVTACTNGNEGCPDSQRSTIEDVAIKSKGVLAVLTQIPNQALIFANDPEQRSRTEDAGVAYTWDQFVHEPTRPDKILYFPMAKAAVMATKVLSMWSRAHPEILKKPLEKFYISGASKRGATTWFSSAYMGAYHPDTIIGAAPLVFDTLNFTYTAPAMWQQLGGFSFAFHDYAENNIIDIVNNDAKLALLTKHIDPLYPWYSKGLDAVPKLVVNAVGDEFFLITNDRFYYNSLTNKLRLMIPDAEHSMATGLAYLYNGTAGHFRQLALKKPLPKWIHKMDYATNTIRVLLDTKPTSISVFKATSPPSEPTRMDFRLIKKNIPGGCLPPAFVINEEICGSPTWWKATDITETGTMTSAGWLFEYTALGVEIPQDGKAFFGFYLMAAWENDVKYGNQVYSTQVMVLPEKFPFASCVPNCEPVMV